MKPTERLAAAAFLLCGAAAVALLVVYVQHSNTQWEGALLGLALAAFGVGFLLVARGLLPPGPAVDIRVPFGADIGEAGEVEESFERIDVLSRRRFLLASTGSAIVALVAVAIAPLRSLGPRPGTRSRAHRGAQERASSTTAAPW